MQRLGGAYSKRGDSEDKDPGAEKEQTSRALSCQVRAHCVCDQHFCRFSWTLKFH